jgi:uncharacterized protein (TIGR03083 family)
VRAARRRIVVGTSTFVELVRDESRRLRDVLADVDLDAAVPSCPGWSVADLLAHLAEVQDAWAQVAGQLLQDPEGIVELPRPADEELRATLADRSAALVAALSARQPEDRCWSWSELGGDVAWVARRQAHEALVHRIDAELAAGLEVTPVAPEIAADGVDELVRGFLVGVPDWAQLELDGVTVGVWCTDVGSRHVLALGRMTGTSPTSGRSYDLPAASLADPATPVDAEVAGPAWALDRWLWGRGEVEELTVRGYPEHVDRLRELVADATQ